MSAITLTLNTDLYVSDTSGIETRHRAFDELVWEHYALLLHVASDSGTKEEPGDIVQDVLLEAWQNKNTMAVSPDTLFDLLRYAIGVRRHLARECIMGATQQERSVGELSIDADQDSSPVMNAFWHLPKRYRDVLTLRFLQQKSVRETARSLHLSHHALRMRTAAALRTLRRNIPEDDRIGISGLLNAGD